MSTNATAIRINWTEARSARNAIAELKTAGAKFDGATKLWTLDDEAVPAWYMQHAEPGMSRVEWAIYRANNFGRCHTAEAVS